MNLPLLQRCPLGYLNLALGWNLKKRFAEAPLISFTTSLGFTFMDVFTTICMCSGITLIIMILMLCLKQTFRIQPSTRFLYSGLPNILCLYFVQNWMCQKAIPTEWLFRSYNFIKLMLILDSRIKLTLNSKFISRGLAWLALLILMKTRINILQGREDAIPLLAEANSILAS